MTGFKYPLETNTRRRGVISSLRCYFERRNDIMLLIGTTNTATQAVAAGGIINLGATYRRYCKKNSAGTPAFTNTGTALSLNHSGIYHVTGTFVAAGTAAGVVTVGLSINGVAVPYAFASETITTAGTELRTLVIDDYVLVDNACVLGTTSTTPAVLRFTNTGVAATFSQVTVNAEKVV